MAPSSLVETNVHSVSYALKAHENDEQVRARTAGEFRHALDTFNMPRYEACNHDMASASSASFNNAKYMRLDGHGPQVGPLNDRCGGLSPAVLLVKMVSSIPTHFLSR